MWKFVSDTCSSESAGGMQSISRQWAWDTSRGMVFPRLKITLSMSPIGAVEMMVEKRLSMKEFAVDAAIPQALVGEVLGMLRDLGTPAEAVDPILAGRIS